MKMKKLVVTLLLVAAFTVLLTGCSKSVSLEEGISVTFGPFNGYAEPDMEIDRDYLDTLVDEKAMDKYLDGLLNEEFWGSGTDEYFSFGHLIAFQYKESYSNLSNGDTVTVVAVASEELELLGETLESLQEGLNITFDKTEFTFTVEGLEDAQVLDVANIAKDYLHYEGANGGGSVYVEFPDETVVYESDGFAVVQYDFYCNYAKLMYNNEKLGALKFYCEPNANLTAGDTVRITVDYEKKSDTTVEDMGYVLNRSTEVTVPDLGEYVTDFSQITAEMKEDIMDAVEEELGNRELEACYWGTAVVSAELDNPAEEGTTLLLLGTGKGWFGSTYQVYISTDYLILQPDGTLSFELNFDRYGYVIDDYDFTEVEF